LTGSASGDHHDALLTLLQCPQTVSEASDEILAVFSDAAREAVVPDEAPDVCIRFNSSDLGGRGWMVMFMMVGHMPKSGWNA
jgi:hypothetical protein